MALKPNGRICAIKEQIIEDPVSGLTFQFAIAHDDEASPVRLKIFGSLPYGNRELLFDPDGALNGTGTALVGSCNATWIREVSE